MTRLAMQYPRFSLPSLLCIALGWFAMVPTGACKHITLAISYDVPPYIMQQGESGLQIEILREALAYRGHTFSHVQVPTGRLQVMVSKGMADAAAGTRRQPDGTFYSHNFITFHNVLVTKAESALAIGSVKDLKGLRLAAWQNAYRNLGPEFYSLYNPKQNQDKNHFNRYYEIPKQISQVKMFWAGHVEAVVIDRHVFAYLTAQLINEFDTAAELVFHDLFEPDTHFQVNFSTRQLRDDFNQGLAALKQSGRYAELVSKYLSMQEQQEL